MRNTCIAIVTHGPIYEEFYLIDSTFDPDIFLILSVGDRFSCDAANSLGIRHIHCSELHGFKPLGKQWAETEAIYTTYTSGIYNYFEMVGFIHYDYCLYDGFCDRIKSIVNNREATFVSFSTYLFDNDFRQGIILDPARPNLLQARGGPSCYHTLIRHFNTVYNSSLSIGDLVGKRINLCSAYLCTPRVFADLMRLISYSVKNALLEDYDTQRNHRIQGGMAERYVGVYSSNLQFLEIELAHMYNYHKKLARIP
jgi:hypothetical protein